MKRQSLLRSLTRMMSSSSLSLTLLLTSSLQSCTTAEFNEIVAEDSQQPIEVTITLSTIDFTINPSTVPGTSGITRASDATPVEAGITRIALKVFDKDGVAVADISQIAAEVGEEFNKLKVQLPAGTYTFVAVAHDTSADNIGCATIESPEVVTLPEAIIPTLYAHVEDVTIANANNQSVAIDMGKRINATLRLASTDIVPTGVSRMAFDINSKGTKIGASNLPQINPTSGYSVGQYRFSRVFPVEVGKTINVSMNLLLPADEYSFPTAIHAQDASNLDITEYDRSFNAVPFQRAYITDANGQYFRYVNNSSLNFDTTIDSRDFAY